jgi:hypothetical protein
MDLPILAFPPSGQFPHQSVQLANLLRQFIDSSIEMLDAVISVLRMFAAFAQMSVVKFALQMLLKFVGLAADRLALIRKTSRAKMLGSLVEHAESHVETFGTFAMRQIVMRVLTFPFPAFGMPDQFIQFGLHGLSLVLLASSTKLVDPALTLLNRSSQTAVIELPFDLVFNASCLVSVTAFSQFRRLASHGSDLPLELVVLGASVLRSFPLLFVLRALFPIPPLTELIAVTFPFALLLSPLLALGRAGRLALAFGFFLSNYLQKATAQRGQSCN